MKVAFPERSRKSVVASRPSCATFVSLILSAFALSAFAGQPSDLDVARAALRDGLWQVARLHAAAAGGDEARLVILESYASEGRWDDVKAELATAAVPTNSAAFAYYQAVVDNRLAAAAECLKASGSQAGLAEAKMLEADLCLKRADLPAAKACWAEVLSLTNAGERAVAIASINLGDETAMRNAYRRTVSVPLKRRIALRLGMSLVCRKESEAEGTRLIRAVVADAPDAEGACDAFVALANAAARAGRWKEAVKTYADAVEIWPTAFKRLDVQEGRGEALLKLGRFEEAFQAFVAAEALAEADSARARTILRQGDALSELGRGAEAMGRYRTVLEKYPETETAVALKRLIGLRERETRGRDFYKAYQFEEARKTFAEVAAADPSRKARMDFFEVLCLYGLGRDDEASGKARVLAETSVEPFVRAEAVLWLAKFTYNRCEWKESVSLFRTYADLKSTATFAPVALLWAARAAFADNDFAQSIQIATQLAERYPESAAVAPALLVQAEALVEQARFDEAVLVLDRATAASGTERADRLKARLLKADALFATGVDNPARYQAALEAYRAVLFGEELDADLRLSVAFKIGRTLEKLKRTDEAIDQYYTQVVLAYRDGRQRGERFGDKARAVFSRAAFILAEGFEDRGRDYQAVGILKLVVESGVPAAEEAEKRISRIYKKGLFL